MITSKSLAGTGAIYFAGQVRACGDDYIHLQADLPEVNRDYGVAVSAPVVDKALMNALRGALCDESIEKVESMASTNQKYLPVLFKHALINDDMVAAPGVHVQVALPYEVNRGYGMAFNVPVPQEVYEKLNDLYLQNDCRLEG